MDPDACLAQIRAHVSYFNWRIDNDADNEFNGMSDDDFARLMDLTNLLGSLDEWLSQHGLLPQDWSRR